MFRQYVCAVCVCHQWEALSLSHNDSSLREALLQCAMNYSFLR